MLLAAVSVVSLQNTRESLKRRIDKTHPYWTHAYGDVCAAVDREIALREEGEHLRRQIGLLATELMLRCDDKRSLSAIVEWAARRTK